MLSVFNLIRVVHARGIKKKGEKRRKEHDCIVWGSPAGTEPTLGSHVDEFTNYQHLALSAQPSAT